MLLDQRDELLVPILTVRTRSQAAKIGRLPNEGRCGHSEKEIAISSIICRHLSVVKLGTLLNADGVKRAPDDGACDAAVVIDDV